MPGQGFGSWWNPRCSVGCVVAGILVKTWQPPAGKPEGPTVEGTPGAVEPVCFREQAGQTTLRLRQFVETRSPPHDRSRSLTSKWSGTLASDRGCPGKTGWGKSAGRVAVPAGGSGRGKRQRPLSCGHLAGGDRLGTTTLCVGVSDHSLAQHRAPSSSKVCSWGFLLQKSVGGMWHGLRLTRVRKHLGPGALDGA
jgi:hypothetical protein